MKARITFQDTNKGFLDGLFKTGGYIKNSGISPVIQELINFRVSLMNGCAYCLDMHFKDAVHNGENPQRLYSIGAWRECPYYTAEEQAVLAYTEEVTLMHVKEETFEKLLQFYDKQQIADITLAIGMINVWNRMNIAFQTVPGGYQVGQYA
ncbi:carboxymuconolactone decarboxylase family protein [Chitinophaga sp. Cy-1792]|uniref:carboxymuconolactone decarboxylase family protein n=1 Tax=Chitinophaga sp. Cy-1792 TaxID=2608339 RepID=UPI001420B7CF|nr:carboxymuconolactone decarboxylase family protein [Chitinophaga sp. Cy-1792]NIG57034.1 carboxymuconolactone decarboxylase family protein [Chitinophaga sp. Cy-1792]